MDVVVNHTRSVLKVTVSGLITQKYIHSRFSVLVSVESQRL